jgi:hypothetical protein
MAGAIHADAQEADGTIAQAHGDVPVLSIAAGPGGGTHQPGVARMGLVLCGRTLEHHEARSVSGRGAAAVCSSMQLDLVS